MTLCPKAIRTIVKPSHFGGLRMRCCLFLFLLAGPVWNQTVWAGGGFAHSPDYIGRVNRNAFEGQPPEEIARYLGHFSGGVVGGAVGALAEGGEENLPLIKKLLKDENPWIRGGAIRVLSVMYAPKAEAEGPAAPELTPELNEVMGLISGMLKDPHPEVQRCLGSFFQNVRVENELVHKILIVQAADVDPGVRGRTAEAIRRWIKDPETRTRVGMEVLRRPDDVSPHALALAAIYLYEDKDNARFAIPVVVRYLNVKAHTIRGFFTNGPYQKGLNLIEYHFDEELEKSHGLVQAVCRSIVRIPYSTYGGWMDARKTAVRILERMSPAAAPAVRAAAAEERKWVDAGTDDEIKAVTPSQGIGARSPREECHNRILYLEDMAAWLEAGKPAASKAEFKHPESKKKPQKKK